MNTSRIQARGWLSFVTAIVMLFSIVASAGADGKKSDDKKGKPTVARFLIITPHTAEECLKSLDDYVAQNPDLLKKLDWGCMVGDHTGYVVVEAADETAARNMLPADERKAARIIQVNKFTVEQIQEFHKKM